VSAGCAEGEEPYSLAMLLRRNFRRELRRIKARIVGVDIEEAVLERARAGIYDGARLEELPEDLRQECFEEREGRFHLARPIKEMVEFRAHDIRNGLPLGCADLIMCRNVLIYFTREQQRGMLRAFGDSLRSGGLLVLGKTESMLSELRSGFSVVDLSEHIYRKAGEEPCGWR
jgi:chemotaxis protein methyltransferase CheR